MPCVPVRTEKGESCRQGPVLDGRYRLIEPIGAGGFGQVWKAHDPKVDRQVAVKVLTGDGSLGSALSHLGRAYTSSPSP
jgi:hypothetical protein